MNKISAIAFSAALGVLPAYAQSHPDPKTIIERSVEANNRDFQAAPDYDHTEMDRDGGGGSKTYRVEMIDGSPYQRLLAINGKPLSPAAEAQQKKQEQQVRRQRDAESPQQRKERLAKWERSRKQDNAMMSQLVAAFNFTYLGTRVVRGHHTYLLRATPKPGYRPPNMDSQVLTGMQGQLWVDQKTFNWVKVVAQVIHPVSIEGFLAQVEPGTRFELDQEPVGDGIWLASHFSERANAKVLFMFSHNTQDDETFTDYQRVRQDEARR